VQGASLTGIQDGPRAGEHTLLVDSTGADIRCTFTLAHS